MMDLVWRATWQGTLFVLAVGAMCRVFRRLPAQTRHWLWWLACLQMGLRMVVAPLAVPVLPASPASPEDAVIEASASWAKGPTDLSLGQRPREGRNGDEHSPQGAADPSGLAVSTRSDGRLALAIARDPVPRALPQAGDPRAVGPSMAAGLGSVLIPLWLAGAFVGALLAFRRLIRARNLVRRSTALPDPSTNQTFAEICSVVGVVPPTLMESSDVPCPLVAGLWRPVVVLPLGWADGRPPEELRMALAHELAHVRRRDMWLAFIPEIAAILFYFNPAVWLAAHEASAACEEACDIEALRFSGGSPAAYARVLVGSGQPAGFPSAALGRSLGASFSFRILRRKIHMLTSPNLSLTGHRRRIGIALLALAAVAALPWSITAQQAHKRAKHKKHVSGVTANRKAVAAVRPTPSVRATPAVRTTPAVRAVASTPIVPPPPAGALPFNGPALAETTPPDATSPSPYNAPPTVEVRTPMAMVPGMPPSPALVAQGVPRYRVPAVSGRPQAATGMVTPPRAPVGGFGVMAPPTPALPTGRVIDPVGTASTPTPTPTAPSTEIEPAGAVTPAVEADKSGAVSAVRSTPAMTVPPMPSPQWTGNSGTWFTPPVSHAPKIQENFVQAITIENGHPPHLEIHFVRLALYQALAEAFAAARVDYSISADVLEHDTVTCSLNRASLETALQTILKSAHQRLTYRVENGVYEIVLR